MPYCTRCYSLFPSLLYSTLIYFASVFDEFKRSLTSTSRTLAISSSVSRHGCAVFVHHFETVAGSFPSASASHLLVRFFSANTTFNRLMSLFFCILHLIYCIQNAKILIKFDNIPF